MKTQKMSNYVNNLNELINTKKELKDIIIESTGENPSEVFSYYPSYIRSAIASSGASEEAVNSYISAYLSAYNYIDQDTLSSNSYITMGDVSACGYITQHQDLSSYATKSYVVDYVATYAPTPDLSSYVTKTELSACGYVTANDIDMSGYLPITGGTLRGNLIPSQSASFDLGSSSSRWKEMRSKSVYADATYTSNLYASYISQNTYVASYQGLFIGTDRPWYLYGTGGDGNESVQLKPTSAGKYFIIKDIYNNDIVRIYQVNSSGNFIQLGAKVRSDILPYENNTYTLGNSDNKYANAYSYNYYLGYNVSFNSASDYNLNISLNGSRRFYYDTQTFTGTGTNKNLGTTNTPFAYTYTSYLILNGTDIMDIIGDVETLLANI